MKDALVQGGDLVVTDNDLAIVEGDQATAQRLEQRLRLWRGEWFLDRTAGVPWLRDVIGQRPREQVITGLLRTVILDDPEVAGVEGLELDFVGDTRILRVDLRVRLTDGETLALGVTV